MRAKHDSAVEHALDAHVGHVGLLAHCVLKAAVAC